MDCANASAHRVYGDNIGLKQKQEQDQEWEWECKSEPNWLDGFHVWCSTCTGTAFHTNSSIIHEQRMHIERQWSGALGDTFVPDACRAPSTEHTSNIGPRTGGSRQGTRATRVFTVNDERRHAAASIRVQHQKTAYSTEPYIPIITTTGRAIEMIWIQMYISVYVWNFGPYGSHAEFWMVLWPRPTHIISWRTVYSTSAEANYRMQSVWSLAVWHALPYVLHCLYAMCVCVVWRTSVEELTVGWNAISSLAAANALQCDEQRTNRTVWFKREDESTGMHPSHIQCLTHTETRAFYPYMECTRSVLLCYRTITTSQPTIYIPTSEKPSGSTPVPAMCARAYFRLNATRLAIPNLIRLFGWNHSQLYSVSGRVWSQTRHSTDLN